MTQFDKQCLLDPTLLCRKINEAQGSLIMGPQHLLDPALRLRTINALYPSALSNECLLDPALELVELGAVTWGGGGGDGGSGDWILALNTWDDSGVWDDAATWND